MLSQLFRNRRPSMMLHITITTLRVQFGDASVQRNRKLRIGLIVGEISLTGIKESGNNP